MLKKGHIYMWLHKHRLNPLLRTKLGYLLVRSTFLAAHASLWTERSGTLT